MLVSLDAKFTNYVSPSLISIALVGDDGCEFYAESSDYPLDECSAFVKGEILPLLGRVDGALSNPSQLASSLHFWFSELSEPASLIFNSSCSWKLLVDALLCDGLKGLPPMLEGQQFISSVLEIDPVFYRAKMAAYTPSRPLFHALADARALLAGYQAWFASCEDCS